MTPDRRAAISSDARLPAESPSSSRTTSSKYCLSRWPWRSERLQPINATTLGYRIRDCALEASIEKAPTDQMQLRLSLRLFRPPIVAHVTVGAGLPRKVGSVRVSGQEIQAAGPWPTSGEWWTTTAWDRREWDVVLDDGGVYRIYETSGRWFLEGTYD